MKEVWKKSGKYILGIGLYFLVLVNGIWGAKNLPQLEMARRKLARNPNNVTARLEWWKGLVETEYWEEALSEEVYFDSMYQALGKNEQEKIVEIKGLLREKYPVYLREELEKMAKKEEKDKAWWVRKARIEMELGEYEEAEASIGEARKLDRVDEELEKMERELLKNG
jgi:tetratricopeptide (TPR) repeat protein